MAEDKDQKQPLLDFSHCSGSKAVASTMFLKPECVQEAIRVLVKIQVPNW